MTTIHRLRPISRVLIGVGETSRGEVAPRSAGALAVISQVQVAALGAALFGMGAGVKLRSLLRGSGPVLAVAAASTVFIAGISLAGVLLLGG